MGPEIDLNPNREGSNSTAGVPVWPAEIFRERTQDYLICSVRVSESAETLLGTHFLGSVREILCFAITRKNILDSLSDRKPSVRIVRDRTFAN